MTGTKTKMLDVTVYWPTEVTIGDLMADLEEIGTQICRPIAFERGSRITTIKNRLIGDTMYRTAELYLDPFTSREIQFIFRKGGFRRVTAVQITETGA